MHRIFFCLGSLLIVQGCLSLDRAAILLNIRNTPDVIPLDQGGPVQVSVSLKFLNILEVNEIGNQVDVLFLQQTTWRDRSLAWNSSLSQITDVSVPIDSLWSPDLFAYNAISKPEVLTPELARVTEDGTVLFMPSVRQRFSCDVSGVDTEAGATCRIKIGSWTAHSREIFLVPTTDNSFDGDDFSQFSRFEILEVTQTKNSASYPCCPDVTYDDVDVSFTFRNKRLSNVL